MPPAARAACRPEHIQRRNRQGSRIFETHERILKLLAHKLTKLGQLRSHVLLHAEAGAAQHARLAG